MNTNKKIFALLYQLWISHKNILLNSIRDTFKFIIIVFILRAVIFALSYAYMHFSMETQKIKMIGEDVIFPIEDYEAVLIRISDVIEYSKLIPFILGFSVFFSIPQKPLSQITLVSVFIFFISCIVIPYKFAIGHLFGFLIIYGLAIGIWLSCAFWCQFLSGQNPKNIGK